MTTSPAVGTAAIEATTIRKVTARIIPFVFILFVIAALDRNNIGFAALTMNKELGITSQQYGFIAGIFFFGYAIFEIPSNLLLHRVGARVWIARILITWGIITVLSGFARTAHQLYAARFLLGFAEAGYFPGIILYLTYWFRQRELAQTVAFFLTANPVANIIGAPFAGFILDHTATVAYVPIATTTMARVTPRTPRRRCRSTRCAATRQVCVINRMHHSDMTAP